MSDPWMKFYPRDWRGDQALRAVSLAARGLWIECLCIMHEAKPYGHLVLNGAPVDGGTLARMTGVPVDEVAAFLAELRQAGVLSMTGKGVVFSRRMTKDHARAQKGRKAANKRWSQTSGDVEQSEEPNGSPIGPPTTQKPEARSQIVTEPIAQDTTPPRVPMLFDKLCDAAGLDPNRLPHPGLLRIGPINDLASKGYSLETDILPVIRELSVAGVTFQHWSYFVPIVIERTAKRNAIPVKPIAPTEDWDGRVAAWRADPSSWIPGWGPPPGERGCKAPSELLKDAA